MTYSVSALAVLADPSRQAVLEKLRRGRLTVGELAEQLPISRPAVSQHLKVLRRAHLVKERREGTRHYFSLNPEGFQEARAYLDRMWQDALGAFAQYVAEQKRSRRKKKGAAQ